MPSIQEHKKKNPVLNGIFLAGRAGLEPTTYGFGEGF